MNISTTNSSVLTQNTLQRGISHFYPEGYIASKGYYHREVVVAVAVAGDVVAIYVSADNSTTIYCIVFRFYTFILGLYAVT